MPRPQLMRPVFVGRDLGPGGFKLAPEAYCAIAYRERWRAHAVDALSQCARRPNRLLPHLFAALVEAGEHLTPLGIDHRQDCGGVEDPAARRARRKRR